MKYREYVNLIYCIYNTDFGKPKMKINLYSEFDIDSEPLFE